MIAVTISPSSRYGRKITYGTAKNPAGHIQISLPSKYLHTHSYIPTNDKTHLCIMKTPPGFPTRHPSAKDVNSLQAYETRPSSPQFNQPNIEIISIAANNTPTDSLRDKFPVLSSLIVEDGDVEAQRPALKKVKTPRVKKVKQPKPPKTVRRTTQEKRFKEVATLFVFVAWLALWITLVAWGAPKDGGWGEKGKPIKVWAVLAGSLIGAVPVLFSILMCLGNYIRYGGGSAAESKTSASEVAI